MGRFSLSDISPLLGEPTLTEVFQRRTGGAVEELQHTTVKRAAPPGEGLLGAVYRVTLATETRQASFVVKALVQDVLLRNTLRCELFFKREVLFYEKILPILVDVQKSTGATERLQNWIPTYYVSHCDGVNDYMVLEDLAESGFAGTPPGQLLTRPQLGTALKALAHLHACSLALRNLRPHIVPRLAAALRSEIYYSEENREWYLPYLNSALEINRQALAAHEAPNSIYWRKFDGLVARDVYEHLMAMSTLESEWSVVANGDAWAPNFMFTSERAVLLDFQTTRLVPVACDLAYLLFACSEPNITKAEFDGAVDEYFDALTYFLTDMKLDADEVFSRSKFDAELRQFGRYGLLMCLTTIPLSAGAQRCDTLQSFSHRFPQCKRIPLERLWPLAPYADDRHRMRFVNAVRLAVDSNFI